MKIQAMDLRGYRDGNLWLLDEQGSYDNLQPNSVRLREGGLQEMNRGGLLRPMAFDLS